MFNSLEWLFFRDTSSSIDKASFRFIAYAQMGISKVLNMSEPRAVVLMRHCQFRCSGLLSVWITSHFICGGVGATGIEQAYQTPRGSALGNAVIASIDDASAIHHNVAGLASVTGPQVQLNGIGFLGVSEYSTAAGRNKNEDNFAATGSFFLASPLAEGLALGFGVTTPHGLGNDWGDPHPLRALGTQGSLLHTRTSLGLGWQIHPTLKVGASAVYARDSWETSQGFSDVSLGDEGTFEGDGGAWGWTAGLTWEPVKGHRIAFSYRSGIDVKSKGTATAFIPAVPPFIPVDTDIESDTSFEFRYPQHVLLGYAFERGNWLVEFNWQHTDWSVVESFDFVSENAFLSQSAEQDWRDTHFFSLGVSYQACEELVLRAGYLHGTSAVPDDTFTPLIPDSPYHALSFGVGYEYRGWQFDAALILSLREERKVSGSPSSAELFPGNSATSDGTWNTKSLGVHLGLTKTF